MVKLVRVVILILFIIENGFFYIVKNPIPYSSSQQKYAQVVIILLVLFYLVSSRRLKKMEFLFKNEVIILLIFIIFEIFLSYLKYKEYGQTVWSILAGFNYYFVILAYFIFAYYVKKSNDVKKFEFSIMLFNIFLSAIFIAQMILINRGKIFLNIDTSNIRFNSLRILDSSCFISIGTVLSFANFINRKNIKKYKVFGFLGTILGLIEIIYVQKTRMIVLLVIVDIIVMYLVLNRIRVLKSVCFTIVIALIFLFASRYLPIYNNYSSASIFTNDDNSYIIRYTAISYYLSEFNQSPLFGQGLIVPKNDVNYLYYIEHGPNGTAFKSDVGIIGFLATFGIAGIAIFIKIVLKIINVIKQSFKRKEVETTGEMIGILVLILGSSISTSIFDSYRIIMVPICLTIIEFASNGSKITIK